MGNGVLDILRRERARGFGNVKKIQENIVLEGSIENGYNLGSSTKRNKQDGSSKGESMYGTLLITHACAWTRNLGS